MKVNVDTVHVFHKMVMKMKVTRTRRALPISPRQWAPRREKSGELAEPIRLRPPIGRGPERTEGNDLAWKCQGSAHSDTQGSLDHHLNACFQNKNHFYDLQKTIFFLFKESTFGPCFQISSYSSQSKYSTFFKTFYAVTNAQISQNFLIFRRKLLPQKISFQNKTKIGEISSKGHKKYLLCK